MEETARSCTEPDRPRQARARIAAAAQIRDSLSAGAGDSGLQHGHRHQLHHRLQRGHPAAERPSDLQAHWGYVLFTCVNFSMTMVGMMLVDRKGAGSCSSLGHQRHHHLPGQRGHSVSAHGKVLSVDAAAGAVDGGRRTSSSLCASIRPKAASCLPQRRCRQQQIDSGRASLAIIYSYGDYTAATSFVRSDDSAAAPIEITRDSCVPANKVESFFKNPFADLDAAQTAPLKIRKAVVGQVPDAGHGWLVALGLYLFMAFYAMGPGVCVWLALSELMPTRIRSNGMSITLLINQLVSTILAGIFLPFVSKYGYSSMFFLFAWLHGGVLHHHRLLSCRKPRARRWKRLRRTSKAKICKEFGACRNPRSYTPRLARAGKAHNLPTGAMALCTRLRAQQRKCPAARE
jgi:hypothetical protein